MKRLLIGILFTIFVLLGPATSSNAQILKTQGFTEEMEVVLEVLQKQGISTDNLNQATLVILNDADDHVAIINEYFDVALNKYSQYAIDLINKRLLFKATFEYLPEGVKLTVVGPQGNLIFTRYL